MHHLDSLSESEFIGLFETGERYLSAARSVRAPIRFAALFLNGGPKSASSVEHAHVQIVARENRHFAYPGTLRGAMARDGSPGGRTWCGDLSIGGIPK